MTWLLKSCLEMEGPERDGTGTDGPKMNGPGMDGSGRDALPGWKIFFYDAPAGLTSNCPVSGSMSMRE